MAALPTPVDLSSPQKRERNTRKENQRLCSLCSQQMTTQHRVKAHKAISLLQKHLPADRIETASELTDIRVCCRHFDDNHPYHMKNSMHKWVRKGVLLTELRGPIIYSCKEGSIKKLRNRTIPPPPPPIAAVRLIEMPVPEPSQQTVPEIGLLPLKPATAMIEQLRSLVSTASRLAFIKQALEDKEFELSETEVALLQFYKQDLSSFEEQKTSLEVRNQ